MSPELDAPGAYVEELPAGGRQIVGVSTSDTAFVDWFPKGPDDRAVRVTSFDEFTRQFGGLHPQSHGSYAVLQYFLNGGAVAWIVRATLAGDTASTAGLTGTDTPETPTATATAISPGRWGDELRVAVTAGATTGTLDVVVGERGEDGTVTVREAHRDLAADDTAALVQAVNAASTLVRLTDITDNATALTAGATGADGAPSPSAWVSLTGGTDATVLDADGTAASAGALRAAIGAALPRLERIEPALFNLLCLPSIGALGSEYDDLADAATRFCRDNLAFLVLDPPMGTSTGTATGMATWFTGTDGPAPSESGAIYWPRLTVADSLAGSAPRDIGPCGAVAGIYARTDATCGVWTAPAGTEARLAGADLAAGVGDSDNEQLHQIGVNALRTFPTFGTVVWGARTLVGADVRASEWKYVPVRRTALFIEQSLATGLAWAVFEPNDEALWAQIRVSVGAFLHGLFRKGAFQGSSPGDAYVVRCDRETTPQGDIDRGIVTILVGFAPLKPAEFVVLQIQQRAGQPTP